VISTSAFHILLALADGERHGYAITREVAEETGGEVKLGPGTLYRMLKQLLDDEWIVEIDRTDSDDPRRRYYKLTPRGRRVAQAEAQRLANVVRLARARRLLPTGA
jgi:DNA-binding PadR family transcriptional regulator